MDSPFLNRIKVVRHGQKAEKPKRKFKRGDMKMTPLGNGIIGILVSICIGAIMITLSNFLPEPFETIGVSYWAIQMGITALGGLIYCLDAGEPEYALVVNNFVPWRWLVWYFITWPGSTLVFLWKKLAPLMFEKVE